jgi:hypothetical protein
MDDLAAAYGNASDSGARATVVRIEGGHHIPRIEPAYGAGHQAP